MNTRIKIFPGEGATTHNNLQMRRTMVELPFSELTPSTGGSTWQVVQQCERALDRLTPHQRDVALTNLLAKYGSVQRGR